MFTIKICLRSGQILRNFVTLEKEPLLFNFMNEKAKLVTLKIQKKIHF